MPLYLDGEKQEEKMDRNKRKKMDRKRREKMDRNRRKCMKNIYDLNGKFKWVVQNNIGNSNGNETKIY